jgi:prepilin-type N-terminal cleavage/methylation domain-containing protein
LKSAYVKASCIGHSATASFADAAYRGSTSTAIAMQKSLAYKSGFTLVEVMIVVVVMAILAGTVVPQYFDCTHDTTVSTAQSNLVLLRAQIELYRFEHAGGLPSLSLAELTGTTNQAGNLGAGATYNYGPYLGSVPTNTVTQSNTVVAAPAGGVMPTAVVPGAGWQYDVGTGAIWFNDNTYLPFSKQ